MNIRLLALLFSFAAYLIFAAIFAARDNAVKHATLIQSLQLGPSFTSNNQSYQYLPEVRAVRLKSDSESRQQALRRVGATATQHLATKGPYALYRGARRATAKTDKNQGGGTFPATINNRGKTIGILPG